MSTAIWLIFIAELLSYATYSICLDVQCDSCTFPRMSDSNDQGANKLVQRLHPLCGKSVEIVVDYNISSSYRYEVGICKRLDKTGENPDAAVIQWNKDKAKLDLVVSLGSLQDASIVGGTDWIMLTYDGGTKYNSHCTGEHRRTILMIRCQRGNTRLDAGSVRMKEEVREKKASCYYLFEVDHEAACGEVAPLSAGSVFVVVVVALASLYLVLGFLYQRFVAGAHGWDQLPNYRAWRSLGNLAADGCNFVFRSEKGQNLRGEAYRGIGTDSASVSGVGNLSPVHSQPPTNTDDDLLNM